MKRFTDRFHAVTDPFTEIFFNILSNHKNNLIETSLDCIMDGIIHNDLIV